LFACAGRKARAGSAFDLKRFPNGVVAGVDADDGALAADRRAAAGGLPTGRDRLGVRCGGIVSIGPYAKASSFVLLCRETPA